MCSAIIMYDSEPAHFIMLRLPVLLPALHLALGGALPPSAEPRVFVPSAADGDGGSAPQPFPWLHGGAFTGPPIPFHADPLARYVWAPGVDASVLQIFALLPASVDEMPGTAPGAFGNASSLLARGPRVAVAGAGALKLDFGLNSAAWLEFDSPDLTPAGLAAVTLGVSEYDEYEITNLGAKVLRPTAYPGAAPGSPTTYRLEIPHPDKSGLYEGVQFAWLNVNATPAAPWHITGLRLVCQVKPTNWGGAFAAPGDDLLSSIWYLGAYTVKVNLLADQFGSILIYRGDRFSWTGDAHVAQATAMAALGNFDFVGQNLNFTRNNCNGIESYCLYFVLSVADFYDATADTTTVGYLVDFVTPKLEHAHDVWGKNTQGGFYGWDDRL
jgi:alpha-L-rhamnosidase